MRVNIYLNLSIANLQISNLEFSHIPLRVFIYYQQINGDLGQHPTRPQQIKHAGILPTLLLLLHLAEEHRGRHKVSIMCILVAV